MLDVFRKTDECSVFWTSLLTILFTTEALKVSKGGVHGKAVMVCQCMPVDTLQSAVAAVAQSLNDVLVRDACSMQGAGHMVPVVMQAEMREAVTFQKPAVSGGQSIRVDVAHVALLTDQVDNVGRHFHVSI